MSLLPKPSVKIYEFKSEQAEPTKHEATIKQRLQEAGSDYLKNADFSIQTEPMDKGHLVKVRVHYPYQEQSVAGIAKSVVKGTLFTARHKGQGPHQHFKEIVQEYFPEAAEVLHSKGVRTAL